MVNNMEHQLTQLRAWGNADTQSIIDVQTFTDGTPNLNTLKPADAGDDWTPPQLVPLVKLPMPELPAGKTARPTLIWHADRVERNWILIDLTPEEIAALQPKPVVVSMRAFREACGRDLIIRINAYVASVTDVYERFKIQNDLEFAPTVSRAHPRVSQLAAAIGKTENEIDEVFELAQQLDAA
jgi:hypothetical protein